MIRISFIAVLHPFISAQFQIARPTDTGGIVAWAVLLLLALFLYYAWRNSHDFTITVHRQSVKIRGKFPAAKRADVAGFLVKDLAAEGKIRIQGKWTAPRVLRVSVSGLADPGQRQQIRNYLKLALGG